MKSSEKQRATIYTMMLIVAFVALVLACVVMYLELKEYQFDIEAKDYDAAWNRPVSLISDESFI